MTRLRPLRNAGEHELLLGLARKSGQRIACFLDETSSWFGCVAVDFDPWKMLFRAALSSSLRPENEFLLSRAGTKVRMRFPAENRVIYFMGYVQALDGARLELRLDIPFFEQDRRVHPRLCGEPDQYFSYGDLILPVHDISVGGVSTIVPKSELSDVLQREAERSALVTVEGHPLKARLRVANHAGEKVGFRFIHLPYALELNLLKRRKAG
ncbi:MAG: hypothetical protein ACXVCS_19870 [Bdellovibrionota bacterium]